VPAFLREGSCRFVGGEWLEEGLAVLKGMGLAFRLGKGIGERLPTFGAYSDVMSKSAIWHELRF